MGTLIIILGLLASGSTLLKNEANCSLVAAVDCFKPPVAAPAQPIPALAVMPAHVGYEGLVNEANPSLGGK